MKNYLLLTFGLFVALMACNETNNTENTGTANKEIKDENSEVENTLDESKIIGFFKSIDYIQIPIASKIKEVKNYGDGIIEYEFDFGQYMEDEGKFEYQTGGYEDVSPPEHSFKVLNGKDFISSNFVYSQGLAAVVEGRIYNKKDTLEVYEISGLRTGNEILKYVNGKLNLKKEYQLNEQKQFESFLKANSIEDVKFR